MRYFNSSGDPATFSDLWSYIFGDIWKEMREQQLQASYRWVSVVQGSGGLTTKPLPSQKLTVRTSKDSIPKENDRFPTIHFQGVI